MNKPTSRCLPSRFSPSYLIVLLLLALASLGLSASSYFPEFFHTFTPKVGGWSEYHIQDARGETADLTFAIVSEENGAYWMELRTSQGSEKAVVAFLIKGDPTDDANVLKIRAKDSSGPALEMDRSTLEKLKRDGHEVFGGQALPIGPTVGKLQPLPDEVIKVGRDSLKCRHIKVIGPNGQDAEVWLNDEVIPFGVVKLVSGSEQVVLKDFGKRAKAELKGPFTPLVVQ